MLVFSDTDNTTKDTDIAFWGEAWINDEPIGIFAIAGAAADIIKTTEKQMPPTRGKGKFRLKGGAGSGHFQHAGRPGEVGGSQANTYFSNEEKYAPGTIKKVRKMAQHYGAGFEKGAGYYYFTGFNFDDPSVYVYVVGEMTLGQWESELQHKLDNVENADDIENAPRPKFVIRKGGAGSGHHGHAGRPGTVGGSVPGKGTGDFQGAKANPDGKDTMEQYMNPDGTWTAERQALHNKIIAHFFQGKTPVDNPVSYMMGGGPASGKSTLLNSGLVNVPENSVLAAGDEIKAMLPEYDDGKQAPFVHEESSYLSKIIADKASDEGYNVILDGTGDGGIRSVSAKVDMMGGRGQEVVGIYVTVDTDTAVQRSISRAQKTGRYMPESVLRENHRGVSAVFPWILSSAVFDRVELYDTNGDTPKLIVSGTGNDIQILDQGAYNKFLDKARG